jgi:hypothetical protein
MEATAPQAQICACRSIKLGRGAVMTGTKRTWTQLDAPRRSTPQRRNRQKRSKFSDFHKPAENCLF